MESNLKEYLKDLPEYCRLIPLGWVDKKTGDVYNKRPINNNWRNDTYTLEQVCKINKTGIGIVQGETGNGILCLDFDGVNSQPNFKDKLGIGLEDLPPTVAWSSGTPHRHQRAFIVPESEWSRISHHDTISEVEIRWTGQSVIAGKHPSGRNYQWLKGCSPSDLPIAEAPEMLIAAIEAYGANKNTSTYIKRTKEELTYDSFRVDKYLTEYLQPANEFSDYATWLKVGMALHHLSQELGKERMHYQDWVQWSYEMNNFDEEECDNKWVSFGKSANKVTFATIAALAKKHPKFVPSKAPEEAKEVITDKPPKTYTELREEIYEALCNDDENEYQSRLSELRRDFFKTEKDIQPQLLKLQRDKYSNKKLIVGEIDINQVRTLDYSLEGFLPAGEVVHLFSPWGCGKTSLTLGMIRALAEGTGFIDQEKGLKPRKSLFIQADSGSSRCKATYEELGMDEDPRFRKGNPEQMLHLIGADIEQGTTTWNATVIGFEFLIKNIIKLEIDGAVFIDSVKGMMEGTGLEYTNNEHVKAICKTFLMIADLFKISIVLINHKGTDKQEGSGAKAWSESAGMVIELRNVDQKKAKSKNGEEPEEAPDCRELLVRKDSIGGRRDFKYFIVDQRHTLVDPSKLRLNATEILKNQLIKWSDQGKTTCTTTELLLIHGISDATVYREVAKLPRLIKRKRKGLYKIMP